MHTYLKLAAVLREEGLPELATRAQKGEFHDFLSESATPIWDLCRAVEAAGRPDLAVRARAGEWDATKEEAEEWARSPEGQETLKNLPRGAVERMMGGLKRADDYGH